MTLFTYTIPFDDGSAPNPFGGICTLAICKPAIRGAAKPGDWVAGLGSKNAPNNRDMSGKLVYAMLVKEKLSWPEYDERVNKEWRFKLPDFQSLDMARRLGDCLYDHSGSCIVQRRGVHPDDPRQKQKDLRSGVLVAEEFYYFGASAIELDPQFNDLIHQTQGHKSVANDNLAAPFVAWIRGLKLSSGQLHGWPDFIIDWSGRRASYGGSYAQVEADDGVEYVRPAL